MPGPTGQTSRESLMLRSQATKLKLPGLLRNQEKVERDNSHIPKQASGKVTGGRTISQKTSLPRVVCTGLLSARAKLAI